MHALKLTDFVLFLSTLSLRRATVAGSCRNGVIGFLSTLSLRRATIFAVRPYDAPIFLSTLSLRRATFERLINPNGHAHFYPRSPCGERPGCQRPCERPTRDFYPRSPCGERLMDTLILTNAMLFLSTLSLRRATRRPGLFFQYFWISIHALLAESDVSTMIIIICIA